MAYIPISNYCCLDSSNFILINELMHAPEAVLEPLERLLDMALDLARRAKVGRTVLTHMDKSMDYRSLCDEVPDHVTVGYDGLTMTA